MDVKCLKGTREKFMVIKGEIYIAEKFDNKWLVVECEDGVKRNFLKNRFRVIKWKEIK